MHIWYLPANPSPDFSHFGWEACILSGTSPGALTVTLHSVVMAYLVSISPLAWGLHKGLDSVTGGLFSSTVSRGLVHGDHLNVCWMNWWLSFICPSASFLWSLQYILTKPSEFFLPEVSSCPLPARCLGSWARPSSPPISALAEASWSLWVQLNACRVEFWEDGGSRVFRSSQIPSCKQIEQIA